MLLDDFPLAMFFQPSNIFLHRDKRFDGSYEYRVKIGDFGLARTDLFRQDPPHGTEFTSMIEPLSPLFPPGNCLIQLSSSTSFASLVEVRMVQ